MLAKRCPKEIIHRTALKDTLQGEIDMLRGDIWVPLIGSKQRHNRYETIQEIGVKKL